jgi:hypothetical protein
MVTGAVVVNLGRDGEMPEWFSLVAFGTISEVLTRHREGAERVGLSVCVDSIASARKVRPRKRKVQSRDK